MLYVSLSDIIFFKIHNIDDNFAVVDTFENWIIGITLIVVIGFKEHS